MHRFASCRPLGAVLAAALLLGACDNITESPTPTTTRYGAVSIRGTNTSATAATANATVIFFDGFTTAVPNSALQQSDQCTFQAIDTATVVTKGVKKLGDNVSLAIGSNNITLPYEGAFFRYANPAGAPFAYQAGESVTATIPGAGALYPAANISVKLAEPIIPGPVAIPGAGLPLVVTWNATNDATSAVRLIVKYSNPASVAYQNEQIICQLKDDGRHEIPFSALSAFLASPNVRRSLLLTRYRTNESRPDATSLLHIASSVDTTIVF